MDDSYRALFKNDAIRAFFSKIPWVLNGSIQDKTALRRCLENEAARFKQWSGLAKFSLISPMYNTNPSHLLELVWSCLLQTYPRWEIILYDDGSPSKSHLQVAEQLASLDARIKFIAADTNNGISTARNSAIEHASGDFICVMDHDDLLHPQTLGIYARVLQDEPSVNFLFCNEVKVSNDGTKLSDFYSKPAFSYATLLRTNYICHFTAVKRELLIGAATANGTLFDSKYDGFEDHNLFIRLAEAMDFRPRHIPIFGYYWRKAPTSTATEVGRKPDIWRRDRDMLLNHLGGHHADIAITNERGTNSLHSIHFKQAKETRISVVIPFKDRADLTIRCLQSLEMQETTSPLDVVLVDNNSAESKTSQTLEKWLSAKRRHRYTLTSDNGPFNYSAINNQAVKSHCKEADFVLFLNNDVELSCTSAVTSMAAEMQVNPRIGICGLRLMYPSNQGIQHGGMGLRHDAARLYSPRHLDKASEFVYDEHVVFAVTFACAMVRKEAFDKVNGFDDVFFANGLSDVDLCCRTSRAGYEIFYFGTLTGIHHESASRAHQAEDYEIQALNERHASILQAAHIRQYGYDLVVPSDSNESWFETPLRYKVADALNGHLKRFLGPAHSAARKILKRS